MPVIQSIVTQMPRLLDLVNMVLDDCKQPRCTTVVNAKPLVNVIVNGINDAIIDIYTRAKWKFRIAEVDLPMSVGQSDYLVPADFGSIEQDISFADQTIYFVPYGSFLETTTSKGQPSLFTLIDGDHFRFSPVPTEEFVAAHPALQIIYERRPVLVAVDDDRPNLPMEFQDALKAKGRLRWKAAQEYSQADLQMEEGTYEAMIVKKMASYLKTPGKRQGMRTQMKQSVRSSYRRF